MIGIENVFGVRETHLISKESDLDGIEARKVHRHPSHDPAGDGSIWMGQAELMQHFVNTHFESGAVFIDDAHRAEIANRLRKIQ